MVKPKRKDKEASEKRQLLRHLIDLEGTNCTNAIVFCNRKTDVDICSKSLNKYGYQAAPIHGDLDQTKRTETLESFREGDLRILVASDVAARGLDIPSVSHVFNFDVPIQADIQIIFSFFEYRFLTPFCGNICHDSLNANLIVIS